MIPAERMSDAQFAATRTELGRLVLGARGPQRPELGEYVGWRHWELVGEVPKVARARKRRKRTRPR